MRGSAKRTAFSRGIQAEDSPSCLWCEAAIPPRVRRGFARRFCSARCRAAFSTARIPLGREGLDRVLRFLRSPELRELLDSTPLDAHDRSRLEAFTRRAS